MKILILAFQLWALVVCGQVMDLSKFNFNENKPTSLRGAWQFFPNRLVKPSDTSLAVSKTVNVPHAWIEDGNEIYGVGTYRIQLRLPAQTEGQLGVYIPYIRCAAKIFLNGKLIDSLGSVEPSRYKSKLSGILFTLPDKTEIDLLIQVSNFEFRWGGLNASPRVGKLSTLVTSNHIKSGLDIFFVGSLVAISIYLVAMYFLYREGYSFLFLALICLAVVLRSLTTEGSSILLPALFPEVGWGPWKKIEFFSVYSITALFPLYVSNVFPNESNRKIDLAFFILALLLCGLVMFTPHPIYVLALDICHIGLILGFIYACRVAYKAWKNNNPDARTLLTGILVAFPFILLEILKNSALQLPIPFTHLVEFGVLSFLLFQVYVLANHYAMTYQNLEVVVKNKTAELQESNEIKNKMLAILSHDVRGPVNNLKMVMNMFNKGHLNNDEVKPMTRNIEQQAGDVSLLIENILMLVKSQMSGVVIQIESFNLSDWVSSHFSLYNMQASEKQIRFKNEMPEVLMVKADKNIVSLVTRNLIANAIKYSNRGTSIIISAVQIKEKVILSVTDTGKGMTDNQIQFLFNKAASIKSISGTEKETGTGLGLKLCRDYLIKMGSDFTIRSEVGKGTTVSISLDPD